MSQDEVGVKITADDSGLAPVEKAGKRIKDFGKEAERAAAATEKAWRDASTAVGKSLTALSVSMAAGFAVMGKQAAEMEANLRNVNTMAKLNEKGFKGLENSVIALADKLQTKGPKELSAALYDIYSAGLKGEKAMSVLTAAAKAADAGLTETKTAAAALTTTMIAYNLPAEKAAHVTDILFKSVEVGKAEFGDLAASIGPVATKAATFGVSLEEVGAAMAQLSLRSGSASEAATQLERVITQIAAPTEESAKMFRQFGIETGRAALQKKGLVGVLLELKAAYGDADAATRKALSSSEAMQAALVLTSNSGKDYAAALAQMGQAEGSIDRARAEQLKSAQKQWQAFLATVETAAVKFGLEVLPLASRGLQAATDMVKHFSDLSPQARGFATSAGLVTMAVTGITGSFLLLAPQIAALPKAFAVARTAIALTMGGVPGIIAIGIGAVAGLKVAWDNDFFHIRGTTKQILSDVQTEILWFSNWLENLQFKTPKIELFPPTEFDRQKAEFWAKWEKAQARAVSGRPNQSLLDASGASKLGLDSPLPGWSRLPQGPPVPAGFVAPPPKPTIDPEVKRLLSELDKARKFQAIFNPEAAGGKKKKHEATEDELRRRMVEAAESFIGVAAANKSCADTVRKFATKAHIKLGEEHENPFDLAALQKAGLGRPGNGSLADSLAGGKVGRFVPKGSQKPGDIALYSSGRFEGRNTPGVIDHVGMYAGNGEVIHASSSRGQVVRDRAESVGNLIGYVSPNAYRGKHAGMETGDPGDDYYKSLQEAREKFLHFIGQTGDDTLSKLADLEKSYQEAKGGAFTKEEGSRLDASYKTQRSLIEQSAGPADGGGADMTDIMTALDERRAQSARENFDHLRSLGQAHLADRIAEIQQELTQEQLSEDTKRALEIESYQLKKDLQAEQQAKDDEHFAAVQSQIQFEEQMGQLTLEQKRLRLQQELEMERLTAEQKRQIMLELHATEQQLQADQFGAADQVYNSITQSFDQMLVGALTQQQSFNQTFASLWKAVANSIISELVKMIVKALALQTIMRGIFGAFGGIFGGLGGVAGGAQSAWQGALSSVPGAHTGGMVVPGGVQSFHTGGLVGGIGNLRPDEVLAKLQVGEMVLSRDHVQQAASNSGGGNGPISISFGDIHAPQNADPRSFARDLADQMLEALQGAR